LELVNSNFVTEAPRPIGPLTKYVGPMLPTPAQPLPAELDEWLAGSGPLGAVFVSFGVTLNAPIESSRTVLRAIASLQDVRFVWKLTATEQATLQADLEAAKLPNLKVVSWVPQNDLLGHPKISGFVTQVRACVGPLVCGGGGGPADRGGFIEVPVRKPGRQATDHSPPPPPPPHTHTHARMHTKIRAATSPSQRRRTTASPSWACP